MATKNGSDGHGSTDLRHAHATIMPVRGIHPKVVSERLGHAGIAITLDTYSHVIPSLQTEAAFALVLLRPWSSREGWSGDPSPDPVDGGEDQAESERDEDGRLDGLEGPELV
ncbi:MAG TPA: hypothetical protein VJ913_05720, partial [Actinomycetota bacterium]|nr:hypothetical protein [Actinomycetota bacterium]